jgi:Ser/Thr protein kinase RdoA (MazF antagonist)
MDTFTIYTLGGGAILKSIFDALASLLKPDSAKRVINNDHNDGNVCWRDDGCLASCL